MNWHTNSNLFTLKNSNSGKFKNFPNFICHVRQNLFHTFIEAKAIEATELKLEFSGIPAMSYEFSRRGGMAHKWTLTLVC